MLTSIHLNARTSGFYLRSQRVRTSIPQERAFDPGVNGGLGIFARFLTLSPAESIVETYNVVLTSEFFNEILWCDH